MKKVMVIPFCFIFFLSFISCNKFESLKGSIVVNGLERDFYYHLPENFKKKEHLPLLIALHGGGGSGRSIMLHSNFNYISDRERFIVLYPNGIKRHWNDGRKKKVYYAHRKNIDDVGFISKLMDFFIEKFNADRDRIYVVGMSNGGLMTFKLTCEIPEKITAIATVSASMSVNLVKNCKKNFPLPVLLINGTEDSIIRWGGGEIRFFGYGLGEVIAIPDLVNYWIKRNGCDVIFKKRYLPDKDSGDGTKVYVRRFLNSKTEIEVLQYVIEGGGHSWPGGFRYMPEFLTGKICRDIDGGEVIWNFFKRFSK